jgi:hypothetical protein
MAGKDRFGIACVFCGMAQCGALKSRATSGKRIAAMETAHVAPIM